MSIDSVLYWIVKRQKKLMVIPITLLILSLFGLVYRYSISKEFLERDFDLKGGTRILVSGGAEAAETLEREFPKIRVSVSKTPLGDQINIEVDPEIDPALVINKLYELGIKEFQVSQVGPILGEYFWDQVKLILPIVLVLISILVFITFRSPIPAITILFCILSNAFFVVGIMALLRIDLSLAGVASLLMLIGYSVDDDILLYTHALKRQEDTLDDRIVRAMKTGMTMTGTALLATLALYLVGAGVMKEIANVLVLGLIADFPYTWIQSASLLKIYLKK